MLRLFWPKSESLICNVLQCVTLTFEVWIWVKVTAQRLNEDNICTKLDGNPSMHT